MRLTDLDPRWLVEDGRRVGFVFRCPTKAGWWQTCFAEAGRKTLCCERPACYEADRNCCPHSQMGLAEAAGIDPDKMQGCKRECAWEIEGGIALAQFSDLTVTPSLDGSAGGLWHGHITAGEIVGGL